MLEVILGAIRFIILIAAGYLLKRVGLFSQRDSDTVQNIIMNLTLPGAIVAGFRGTAFTFTVIGVILISIALNFIMMGLGKLLCRRDDREKHLKELYMLNVSSYSVGNFATPFVQNFFAPSAITTACIFDMGNTIMCTGGSYAIVSRTGNMKETLKKLLASTPFDTYVIMILLCAVGLELPEFIYQLADLFGSANTFLSMLWIGMIFDITIDKSEIKTVAEILSARFLGNLVIAVAIIYFLPVDLMTKKVLSVLVLAPITIVSPIFSVKAGCKQSTVAMVCSLSIPISILMMTGMILYWG